MSRVEDDLAEHHIRTFFSAFGQIKSIVCVHRSRCAFVNFGSRAGAEAAAESCQGKAVIGGCPLRIQWGKPRPLGNIDRSQTASLGRSSSGGEAPLEREAGENPQERHVDPSSFVIAKPPGEEDDAKYPSQINA